MAAFRVSLTTCIISFLVLILILAWLLFSILAFTTAENDLNSQKAEHASTLLTTFVNLLPLEIPTFPAGILDPSQPAAIYAGKLSATPSFGRLTLLDTNGKPILSVGNDEYNVYLPFQAVNDRQDGFRIIPGLHLARVVTVRRDNQPVARAGIILSLSGEEARLSKSRKLLAAYFVLDVILLAGFGAFVLTRIVVRPIDRLLQATEKITDGSYGYSIRISGSSELADLAGSFNKMSSVLKEKDDEVRNNLEALENANRSLKAAKEETVRSEKMASIGLLAAGMAHEIGTPLAAAMGYAEIIASDSSVDASVADCARRMGEECSRIDRIVRGLLDYSRPGAVTVSSVDAASIIDETVALLDSQGAFRNRVVERADNCSVPHCMADERLLQQVFVNLLLNARDATVAGGLIRIRFRSADNIEAGREFVAIDVLDNGCGITPENVGKIFDPFFTTKEPGQGTGLGLAISSRIIESFGGRITVDSREGEGSCFSILLRKGSFEEAEID